MTRVSCVLRVLDEIWRRTECNGASTDKKSVAEERLGCSHEIGARRSRARVENIEAEVESHLSSIAGNSIEKGQEDSEKVQGWQRAFP